MTASKKVKQLLEEIKQDRPLQDRGSREARIRNEKRLEEIEKLKYLIHEPDHN